jgi:hypothetical protein
LHQQDNEDCQGCNLLYDQSRTFKVWSVVEGQVVFVDPVFQVEKWSSKQNNPRHKNCKHQGNRVRCKSVTTPQAKFKRVSVNEFFVVIRLLILAVMHVFFEHFASFVSEIEYPESSRDKG